MEIIEKTKKGSEEQAKKLVVSLKENKATAQGEQKLKEGEEWFIYVIDRYGAKPRYKIKCPRGKICITCNTVWR